MDRRETILAICGSPAAGTPIMEHSPMSALDLPLKVLSATTAERRKSPMSDQLNSSPATTYQLGAKLAGISTDTDALVEPG